MPNRSAIELHVSDFEPILKYYTALGFEVVWHRQPDGEKGYLVLNLDGNILCFWCGNENVYRQTYFRRYPRGTPRGYGVEVIVMVDHIDDYYEKVRKIANIVEPLRLRPWGVRDFRVADPAGYYLRFSDSYDLLDPGYAVP